MELTLGQYELEAATSFGPRVTGLRLKGGPELLAHLEPSVVIDQPGRPFVFRGGHRLWVAPEDRMTYAPDDHDCSVVVVDGSVQILAPPDGAGALKVLVISESDSGLIVEHRVSFTTPKVELRAPWALTQFPLGGFGILPLSGEDTSPLPNRNLVLWPYTALDDPRFTFRADVAIVHAGPGPKLKIGAGPDPGRLGYFRDGWLFTKTVTPAGSEQVPDLGAVGQIFVGDGFCELETVGGLASAGPNQALTLVEEWEVTVCPDIETACRVVLGKW